jgi:hypothetical protein
LPRKKLSVRRKNVCLAWLALQLLLVTAISVRQVGWLVAHGLTVIPVTRSNTVSAAQKEGSTSARQAGPNPVRQLLVGYLHCAGIEGAYGFFAPNVPESYKLAFEFRNRDGSVDYDLPSVDSRAAELRLGSLLDAIGRSDSERYRRILIRMLTAAAWENHPEAVSVHAVFGKLKLPGPVEAERGIAPSYEFIAAYDFERPAPK